MNMYRLLKKEDFNQIIQTSTEKTFSLNLYVI